MKVNEERRVEPAPDTVPVPLNADQAAGMVLVGTAWLEQNAPERLRKAAPAPVAAPDMQPGSPTFDGAEAWNAAPVAAPATVDARELWDMIQAYANEEMNNGANVRAAVERLVKELADVREMDSRAFASWQKERDKLQERAERAEQDAARYRWLRGSADVPAHSVRWGRWEINHWQGANGWRNLLCSELDDAIDDAMSKP